MLNYPPQIGKLQRQLPLIDLNSELKIASFVILGDAELTHEAARLLAPSCPPILTRSWQWRARESPGPWTSPFNQASPLLRDPQGR